jgi:Tol biopolymer transport system component
MALLERQPLHHDLDTEALIEEARRLRRRRWIVGLCIIVVAVGVGTIVGIETPGSTPRPGPTPPRVPTQTAAVRPLVNMRAFSGRGQLAFVSRNTLWLLDGNAQTLHEVELPKGLTPTSPSFSHDGRWLAFVTGSPTQNSASLWIADSNGTYAHRVTGMVVSDAFGWSPHSDLYAVAAGPISTRFPFYQPTTVRLVSPSGANRTLATAPAIVGGAWSPNGISLVVSTMNHNDITSLDSYTVAGNGPTVWAGAPTARGDWLVPAGWWNRWGVVYTVIDNGMVPGGEGSFNNSALYSLSSPNGTPHFLGETVSNDSDGAPTATSNGILAFVSSTADFPRSPMDGKQVQVCTSPSSPCIAAPTPVGDVSLDPSWSPSGSVLAYVTGSSSPGDYAYGPPVSEWYDSHTLHAYDPSNGAASEIASAQGATSPVWSSNGEGLLYVSDNGLSLLPNITARPVEISSPLFAQSDLLDSYYGEVDWSQQFGWSTGTAVTPCYVACNPQL